MPAHVFHPNRNSKVLLWWQFKNYQNQGNVLYGFMRNLNNWKGLWLLILLYAQESQVFCPFCFGDLDTLRQWLGLTHVLHNIVQCSVIFCWKFFRMRNLTDCYYCFINIHKIRQILARSEVYPCVVMLAITVDTRHDEKWDLNSILHTHIINQLRLFAWFLIFSTKQHKKFEKHFYRLLWIVHCRLGCLLSLSCLYEYHDCSDLNY